MDQGVSRILDPFAHPRSSDVAVRQSRILIVVDPDSGDGDGSATDGIRIQTNPLPFGIRTSDR